MDEIKQRLTETSAACIASYEKWSGNKKDRPSAETLQEAIHELRKVSSRLEIELAISERDEMALKPIPIPPHRASRKGPQGAEGDDFEMPDSNNGNYDPQAQQSRGPRPQHGGGGGPRRLPSRPRQGGGGHSGGGGQGGGQPQGN